MKDKFLKVGDVFEVKKGMEVYAYIPACRVFHNVNKDSKNANELHQHNIRVGERLKDKYETLWLTGEYVVTRTGFQGGSTGGGMSGHDDYPDGWNVTAKRLRQGEWDEDGTEISFYQSGCFTATNEKVPFVRKMKMAFV